MKAAKEAKALEQLEEPLVSVETPEIGSKTQLRSNTRDFEYQDVKNQPVALTESPAAEVALDLIRRGVIVMPIAVVASLLVGGPTAAAAVAIGMAIILGNFWVSANFGVGIDRFSRHGGINFDQWILHPKFLNCRPGLVVERCQLG